MLVLISYQIFIFQIDFQVDRVIFTLFLDKDVDIYEKQMQFFFPVNQQKTEAASSNAE